MNQTVIIIGIIVIVALILGVIFSLFLLRHFAAIQHETRTQMGHITEITANLNGRISQIAAQSTQSTSDINRTLSDRLDKISQRLGDSLEKNTKDTTTSLSDLKSRLAVIDAAQKNITDLSGQMVGLQAILSDKQARGAFGEIQLKDLVCQILPPNAYAFQARMSNGKRADCLIHLPNPPGSIVIDAKFPLESYRLLCEATDDAQIKTATSQLKSDVLKHVRDIADKYIINGETAESALMFLPSEAIYAELHARFLDVIDRSYRLKVWIVSPTTLMATLNTVRAVLKDARMQEQAGVIQKEVANLLEDVSRLDQRVVKLKTHFDQAEKDIGLIQISTGKITGRGEKIEHIQLDSENEKTEITTTAPLSSPS